MTSQVLAIDPGTRESAWVLYDGVRIVAHSIEPNEALLERLRDRVGPFPGCGPLLNARVSAVVFESVESFGMAVGREVFETVWWTGRLFEACLPGPWFAVRLTRRDVKLHLCGTSKAKDANIRAALIDRFGGSKAAAIGVKAAPGPLYGIKSHIWAALAIAVTWADRDASAMES